LDRDRSELAWLASTQQAKPGFFHGMHPPVLEALFQRATYQHIAKEQIIFSQGAPAQNAYLLLHGEADIYRAFEATGTIYFARSLLASCNLALTMYWYMPGNSQALNAFHKVCMLGPHGYMRSACQQLDALQMTTRPVAMRKLAHQPLQQVHTKAT
jgi:CRP-like cAMP-binding protein